MSEELKEKLTEFLDVCLIPSITLESALDSLLELFEEYAKEIIGEDEPMKITSGEAIKGMIQESWVNSRNQLRAEQRSRLESQKKGLER